MCIFIYYSYNHICLCSAFVLTLRFGWLLLLSLYNEGYLQIFKCASFGLHNFCVKWEGWVPVSRFNRTIWIVTPTARPKSVRNRCVIEVDGGVLVLSVGLMNCLLENVFLT